MRALLATSAVAKGLFRGEAWDLDGSGGFATPAAAELILGLGLATATGAGLAAPDRIPVAAVGDGGLVMAAEDLAGVAAWVEGPRGRPLLVDAKVTSRDGAWWLEEAFRGH